MAIKNIVVGLDHSDRSDKALQRANQIALLHDARLILEYALDIGAASKLKGLLERVAREEAEERMTALFASEGASFETCAHAGRPFEVLRDAALDRNADLIVLGAHRPTEGLVALSGSTARRLINVAPAPVLVVTRAATEGYRDVLVGFDGSPAAREALSFALALAPAARFTIVSACFIPFSARQAEAELAKRFEDDTRRMVTEALQREARASAKIEQIEIVVRVGEAFGVIMDVLRARQPDLLVLGTSMPALYRQIFGGGIVDLIAADPPFDLLVVKT